MIYDACCQIFLRRVVASGPLPSGVGLVLIDVVVYRGIPNLSGGEQNSEITFNFIFNIILN
jgi:hypothetical protein